MDQDTVTFMEVLDQPTDEYANIRQAWVRNEPIIEEDEKSISTE